MTVSASVTVVSNIFEVTDDAEERLARGTMLAGERLLALASVDVPFELGTLDSSGAVTQGVEDQGMTVEVSYNTPYAARLHEHPEYNFQGGRKGKWLEDAALQNQDELGAIIAAEVAR